MGVLWNSKKIQKNWGLWISNEGGRFQLFGWILRKEFFKAPLRVQKLEVFSSDDAFVTPWEDSVTLWHNVTSARSVPEKETFLYLVTWSVVRQRLLWHCKKRPQMFCWPAGADHCDQCSDKEPFEETIKAFIPGAFPISSHPASWKTDTKTERKERDKYTKTNK